MIGRSWEGLWGLTISTVLLALCYPLGIIDSMPDAFVQVRQL